MKVVETLWIPVVTLSLGLEDGVMDPTRQLWIHCVVICEMGIKIAFRPVEIRWDTECMSCVGLAPTSPCTSKAKTLSDVWSRVRKFSVLPENKSRQLRGGCHSLLGHTISVGHSASSHGPCTLLRAPQGNKALLFSLESLVSWILTIFPTELWRRYLFSCYNCINPDMKCEKL